jgi:hypothetical protein
MERVSCAEAKRMGLSEEERAAILKASEDPKRYEKVEVLMMAMLGTGVGILSLTEKPDNLLMWAHYAAEHTGFVIGFDTSHEYWNNFGDEKGDDHAGVLRKVNYSDRRPSPPHIAAASRTEMYFTKSREWEYEQEWRVFRSLVKPDHVIEQDDDLPICLFDFPKESVTQVFIGCRTSKELEASVAEIMKNSGEYERTEVLRAEIDSAEFKLKFRAQ